MAQATGGRCSFITNGPLLNLRVSNRSPGDTLDLAGPGTIEIVAQGVGRVDFERIEFIGIG